MTDPFNDDVALAEFEAAQRAEWGKWEAAELITVGGTPAYNEGHPVPVANVERLGYAKRGQVRLQPAFVAANPDDPDVKTFLAFAKKYPDHPAAKQYERYQENQAALDEQERTHPTLTFGTEDAGSAKTSTSKSATKSTSASTSTSGSTSGSGSGS